MNRFEYTSPQLQENENYVKGEMGVRLYDGDDKTNYANGELHLTTHRLLWGHPGTLSQGQTCLGMPLYYVRYIEEESGGIFGLGKSKRVVIHLTHPRPDKSPGPIVFSSYHHIKLSFKEGVDNNFVSALNEVIKVKVWEVQISQSISPQGEQIRRVEIKTRTGIVGIERSLLEKQKAADESITAAFQDLKVLMTMAKDMVALSKSISSKIKEKQGDISEDDTVRFKSYLLSLGIDDPVTRDTFSDDSQYYKKLAQQTSDMLVEPLMENGGMMTLADVWCRVNRARGLELVSPEDLKNACKLFDSIGAPMKMKKFPSGSVVIQLQAYNDEEIIKSTFELIEAEGCISPETLAQKINISILLAKERLLLTETAGLSCRDDTVEGIKFYPNLFLTQE